MLRLATLFIGVMQAASGFGSSARAQPFLPLSVATKLAAENAPSVNVGTLLAFAWFESKLRPWAIHDNTTRLISGAFQMSDGTYAQTVSEVSATNPDLAAQMTTKNDPASQSIAASKYLLDGAQNLQSAGVTNPTTLDVRGYYQFGPANGAGLAMITNSTGATGNSVNATAAIFDNLWSQTWVIVGTAWAHVGFSGMGAVAAIAGVLTGFLAE